MARLTSAKELAEQVTAHIPFLAIRHHGGDFAAAAFGATFVHRHA